MCTFKMRSKIIFITVYAFFCSMVLYSQDFNIISRISSETFAYPEWRFDVYIANCPNNYVYSSNGTYYVKKDSITLKVKAERDAGRKRFIFQVCSPGCSSATQEFDYGAHWFDYSGTAGFVINSDTPTTVSIWGEDYKGFGRWGGVTYGSTIVCRDIRPPYVEHDSISEGTTFSVVDSVDANKIWYNGPVSFMVIFKDAGCGVKSRYKKIYYKNNLPSWEPYTNDNFLVSDYEGNVKFELYAEDHLGNNNAVEPISKEFNFDATPPDFVMNLAEEIILEEISPGSLKKRLSGYKISWDPINFDPASSDGLTSGCGLQGYYLAMVNTENLPSEPPIPYQALAWNGTDTLILPSASPHVVLPIDLFERGKSYNLVVKSEDRLGNSKGWIPTQLVFYVPPVAKFDEVKYNTPIKNINNQPEYPYEIYLAKGRDLLENIASIRILRKSTDGSNEIVEITEGYNQAAEILANLDNENYSWKEVNGKLVFKNKYIGSVYAHQKYEYELYLIHKSNVEEYCDSYLLAPPLLNYSAQFSVILSNQEYEFGRLDFLGYKIEPDGNTGIFQGYTNSPITFQLMTEAAGGKDLEGDLLKYTIWSINSSIIKDEHGNPLENWANHTLTLQRIANENMHLYIEVKEYNKTDGLFPIATHTTLHTKAGFEHEPPSEGFFITYDLQKPTGTFTFFRTPEETKELSMAYPAVNTDVFVAIKQNALTDSTTLVASQIYQVYLANIQNSFLDINFLSEEDIAANWLTSREVLLLVNNPPVTGSLPLSDLSQPWTLLPGNLPETEECKIVAMKITDFAGNSRYIKKTILLDTLPPKAVDPATFSHSFTNQDSDLVIRWDSPPTTLPLSYLVTYPLNSNTNVSRLVEQPQIMVALLDLGFNQAVPIAVKAQDAAGNLSPEAVYIPYTKALCGVLSETEYGYEPGGLERYLRWQLAGGIAKTHYLQVGSMENGVFSVTQTLNLLSTNEFIHSHIASHTTNSYRLVAINNFTPPDISYGATFTLSEINIPPSPPVLLLPEQYTSLPVRFSWEAAKDGENDAITYSIYLKQGTADVLLNSQPLTQCDFILDDPAQQSIRDGESYTWFIVAEDEYAGKAKSAEQQFMVDITKPEIIIQNDLQTGFINQNYLTIQCKDLASGVRKAWFVTSDGVIQENTPESNIALTNLGNGLWEGTITLHPGEHYIHIKAMDYAGNINSYILLSPRMDTEAPVIQAAQINLPLESGYYLCNNKSVPIQSTLKDISSGLAKLWYGFAESPHSEVSKWQAYNLEPKAQNDGLGLEKTYTRSVVCEGVDGNKYYLVLKAEDWAGNISSLYYIPAALLYDSSAPIAELFVEGLLPAHSGYYINDINLLSVIFTHTDPHTASYASIAIHEVNVLPIWQPDWELAKAITPIAGKQYVISLQVTNTTHLQTVKTSPSFLFDNSAPFNLNLNVIPQNDLVPGEVVRFIATAQSLFSPLIEYRLAIGKTVGGTDLSSGLNGQINGWLVKKESNPQTIFSFILPQVEDGPYYITLEVKNAVGISTRLSDNDNRLIVRNNQQKIIVRDNGPYSGSKTNLSGYWEYKGAEVVSQFAYRLMAPEGPITAWINTDKKEALLTALELENGKTYWFEARVVFSSGLYSETGSSLGVLIDITPPEWGPLEGLKMPVACQSQDLWLNYSASDPESSLLKAEVLLESYTEADERYLVSKDWLDIPVLTGQKIMLNLDAEGEKLNLVTGQKIYLTLRLTNKAGLSSDRSAPFIIIDNSPPPKPVVIDLGEAIKPLQYPEAHWFWSKPDPESGTLTYYWSITPDLNNLTTLAWYVDEGERTSQVEVLLGDAFARNHGETWYFVVKAENKAGLTSLGFSNGITIDSTAPFIADVKLLGNISPSEAEESNELYYITNNESLKLYIDSYEDVTNIAGYKARLGNYDEALMWQPHESALPYSSSESLISLAPAPEFKPGLVNVFRGECSNSAGLAEIGFSKGVMFDSVEPQIKNIRGYVSGENLFFDWEIIAGLIPVIQYELIFVKEGQPLANGIHRKTFEPGIVINALTENLENGPYILFVKAINAAGLESSGMNCSNSVIIDRSSPAINLTHDEYAGEDLNFYIEAYDGESGIAEYQYALGTSEEPLLLTGEYKSVFRKSGSLNQTIDFLELGSGLEGVQDGTVLLLRVRVRNNAGLWSNNCISKPIIVDKTPPTLPLITTEKYVTTAERIEHIDLFIQDTESGITHYRIAAVEELTPETLATAEWQEVAVSNSTDKVFKLDLNEMILDNLQLNHAQSYFIVVRAKNAARLWSETGYSEEMKVDLLPPIVRFTEGDIEIIVNDIPFDISYTVQEDVSEDVQINFKLIYLKTGAVQLLNPIICKNGTYSFSFANQDYGKYQLIASVRDTAGNYKENTAVQKFRLNTPVEITLEPVFTTPGKPLSLQAYVFDADEEDQNQGFTYLWEFGDDGGNTSVERTPLFKYYHRDPMLGMTIYALQLTVIDVGGKTVTKTTTVTVNNTASGQIYANEIWGYDGVHYIGGDIIVPQELSLTILPQTNIIIKGNPLDGYDHRLTVVGSVSADNVVFKMEEGINATWNGIWIAGTANLYNTTFQQAKRGLTLINNSVIHMQDCIFKQNLIGIHLLGGSHSINRCSFIGNMQYGIKEDAAAKPVITDCLFNGNLFDYYDETETVITAHRLNQFLGNANNTTDKEME